MELWMRSQDKEILVKVNNLSIVVEQDYTCEIINTFDNHQCWELGTYKSKERALEVLDEIQSLLKPKVLLNSGKILGSFEDTIYREPDKVEIQELNTIIYEMPKE